MEISKKELKHIQGSWRLWKGIKTRLDQILMKDHRLQNKNKQKKMELEEIWKFPKEVGRCPMGKGWNLCWEGSTKSATKLANRDQSLVTLSLEGLQAVNLLWYSSCKGTEALGARSGYLLLSSHRVAGTGKQTWDLTLGSEFRKGWKENPHEFLISSGTHRVFPR